MESSQWQNRNHLFCRKVSFLTALHCQFRGVGQGMKQTYLYLWYSLFQPEWDRCHRLIDCQSGIFHNLIFNILQSHCKLSNTGKV
jgi:hypothetical protein